MRNLFSPSSILAVLVLLVLASSADAGIFRKRKCGTSRPAASSCASGSCATTYAPSGAAVSNCPGGVCPIQR